MHTHTDVHLHTCTFKEYLSVENYVKYNLTPPERSAMAQFRFWNTTTKHRSQEIPKSTGGRQTLYLM